MFENLNFRNLGLNPIKLNDHLIFETTDVVKKYKGRYIESKVKSLSAWNLERANAINKT